MSAGHPSKYALDVAMLTGDAAVLAHARDCSECSAHVARAGAGGAAPPWLDRAGRRASRWPAVLGAVSAFAVALVVFAAPQVRTKGPGPCNADPEVDVYVLRAGSVFRWQSGPIRKGDRLELGVWPGDNSHVEVRDGADVLYAGDVKPGGSSTLPAAWEFDDSPGPEEVTVTLSGGSHPWSTQLHFDKEGASP